MSTLAAKPVKVRLLNIKLLPIAAILLLVLALLFMATPLIRSSSAFSARSGITRQFNGRTLPDAGTGTTAPGVQNGFPGPGNGIQGQDFPGGDGSNLPLRRLGGQGGGLLGFSLLGGMTGTIVYAIALLVSLAAAVGMFLTRRWGQVLGILMAVVYLLLALVSFLPMLLMSFMRALNGLSLGLSILHLALAIAVIVLASIPGKRGTTPLAPAPAESPLEVIG